MRFIPKKPIIFKNRGKANKGPSHDDVNKATEDFLSKGGTIEVVDYFGRNPELVDNDTFVTPDHELNQILDEAKI